MLNFEYLKCRRINRKAQEEGSKNTNYPDRYDRKNGITLASVAADAQMSLLLIKDISPGPPTW